MPYTKDELQEVDFYREFIDKKRYDYLDRISKSALNGFRKEDGVLVSFEDIQTGNGLEDADFSSEYYTQFISALQGETGQFLNILNADFNAYMNDTDNLGNFNANMNPSDLPDVPPQYFETDIPAYIQTLLVNKYMGRYRDTIKTSNLEQIIDRSITELADVQFAETLPEGVSNGNVITNEFANDSRKWLIENNQKRIFPTLELFYGLGIPFNEIVMLTTPQLNRIPDGEPVD